MVRFAPICTLGRPPAVGDHGAMETVAMDDPLYLRVAAHYRRAIDTGVSNNDSEA